MEYTGVPKNSRSPNLATLTTLYLLTPEGQEIYYKHTGNDSPHRKGSRLQKLVPKIDFIETPEKVRRTRRSIQSFARIWLSCSSESC